MLTNGTQTVSALEHEPISNLPDPIRPGLKLTLHGELVVRRGLILLTPKNVKVIGGLCEELDSELGVRARLESVLRGENLPDDVSNDLPTQVIIFLLPKDS